MYELYLYVLPNVFTSICSKAFTVPYGVSNAFPVLAGCSSRPVTLHTVTSQSMETLSSKLSVCLLHIDRSAQLRTVALHPMHSSPSFPTYLIVYFPLTGYMLHPMLQPSINEIKFQAALYHLQSFPAITFTDKEPELGLPKVILFLLHWSFS